MSHYQTLARKYRPQTFKEVLGQENIVTTLKNGIRSKRLAQAYVFCGSRGTGKTTIARLLAKALNCDHPTEDLEPCNQCHSCKEITAGHSLDVLEIDGASHRGIDDVRQINDTVVYIAAAKKYKIYIIDEVHMLTKEAFNALLKTLEEPPPNVKFFFATTEPHKVLPTIMSRCQRFNLNRISVETIVQKLQAMTQDLAVTAEPEALQILAKRAAGGLRDAESLLDQIIVFHEGEVTVETVTTVLGVVSKEILFDLDKAGKEGRLAFAFEMAHAIFSEGKDLAHFVEDLVEHFRNILLVKLVGKGAPLLTLSEAEREKYAESAAFYSKEQSLNLIDDLIKEQNAIRFAPSPKIALEAILLHIMRSHQRLPVEFLVRRLTELEAQITTTDSATTPPPSPSTHRTKPPKSTPPLSSDTEQRQGSNSPQKQTATPTQTEQIQRTETLSHNHNVRSHKLAMTDKANGAKTTSKANVSLVNIPKSKQGHYDTLVHFTAVELEGSVKKG